MVLDAGGWWCCVLWCWVVVVGGSLGERGREIALHKLKLGCLMQPAVGCF
jgi:hypothetical protein